MTAQPWYRSWRADPTARALADRHYNRQKVGAAQFPSPVPARELQAPLWPYDPGDHIPAATLTGGHL